MEDQGSALDFVQPIFSYDSKELIAYLLFLFKDDKAGDCGILQGRKVLKLYKTANKREEADERRECHHHSFFP